MSAIFGIIHLNAKQDAPIPPSHLEIMQSSMQEMGPDGASVTNTGGTALGHLSMRITPESQHEVLPYTSPDRRYIITGDTRLDNREELAAHLDIRLPELKTTPDSILLLKGYQKWQEGLPEYVLGEFAFAIWDQKDKKLFCARDHIGIRPFFYYRSSTHFVFASQVGALRSLPFVDAPLKREHLAHYLMVPVKKKQGGTLFEGITPLDASRRLTLQDGKIRVEPYWTPGRIKSVRFPNDRDYAEALRELLTASVHKRIRSMPHVHVGVSLSGGLDSSSLACIAARKLKEEGRELTAVSSVLPSGHQGIETDERRFIRAVAEQESNMRVHYITGEDTGPFTDLEAAFAESQNFVYPNHFMNRVLWKAAREKGIRLFLFGLGGDHLASFNGYNSLSRLAKQGRWIQTVRLAKQLARVEEKSIKNIVKHMLVKPFLPPRLLLGYNRVKTKKNPHKKQILSAAHPAFAEQFGVSQTDILKQLHGGKRKHFPANIVHRLRVGRLAIQNISAGLNRFGFGGLFPFFDKPLVEFCLGVPPAQFLTGGWRRSLIRRAMEGILPPEIQWRKDKQAFSPNFHQRILDARINITRFLDHFDDHDPLLEIVDFQRIRDQLTRVQPVKDRAGWDVDTSTVLARGIIALAFLLWLEGRPLTGLD